MTTRSCGCHNRSAADLKALVSFRDRNTSDKSSSHQPDTRRSCASLSSEASSTCPCCLQRAVCSWSWANCLQCVRCLRQRQESPSSLCRPAGTNSVMEKRTPDKTGNTAWKRSGSKDIHCPLCSYMAQKTSIVPCARTACLFWNDPSKVDTDLREEEC
eukprot:543615-Amphidinium_carterae.1